MKKKLQELQNKNIKLFIGEEQVNLDECEDLHVLKRSIIYWLENFYQKQIKREELIKQLKRMEN